MVGTGCAIEQIRQGSADVKIARDGSRLGNEVFSIPGAIHEGHLHTQDGAHLRLARGEARGGAHHDPGQAAVAGCFPRIGKGTETVHVSDGADIDLKRPSFCRRGRKDLRKTRGSASGTGSHNVPISKAKQFDVAQGVNTIQQHSGDWSPVVANGHRVVCVSDDRVISSIAPEDSNIDARGASLDGAVNAELGRIDRSGGQPLLEGGKVPSEFNRTVSVGESDLRIQEGVSVDEVITAPTLNGVGTTSAQKNVAIREPSGAPQQ